MHAAGRYPLKSMGVIGMCDVRKTARVAAAIVRIKTQLPFLGTLTAEGICCVRNKLVKVDDCQVGRETLLLLPRPCCGLVKGVCSSTLCRVLGELVLRVWGVQEGWEQHPSLLSYPHLPLSSPPSSTCPIPLSLLLNLWVVHGGLVLRGSPVYLSEEVAKARL